MTRTARRLPVNAKVCWLQARHMHDVLAIEDECFDHPWGPDDFRNALKPQNHIGKVIELEHGKGNHEVAAFIVYELRKHAFEILNLAVPIRFRRRGLGSNLIESIKKQLRPDRRNGIEAIVRDSNLDAHLFFKANGFTARFYARNFYDALDPPEDAYTFSYRLKDDSK